MFSEETPVERAGRLFKLRETLKRFFSEETPEERAERMSKMRET